MKKTLVFLLSAFVIVGFLSVWRAKAASEHPSAVVLIARKWQYQTVVKGGKLSAEPLRVEMDLLGSAGWELISVSHDGTQTLFVYKRPV